MKNNSIVDDSTSKENSFTMRLFTSSWELIKSVIYAIAIVVLIQHFVVLPTIVSGDSMKSTMINNERFLSLKAIYYFSDPQQGDIITFHASEVNDYVKRVIALPGQVVEIKSNVVYIDGSPLPEKYLLPIREYYAQNGTSVIMKDFGPYSVPSGSYFVMGDNRPNSFDSRDFGAIKKSKIIGKAVISFWPLDKIRFL
ncbi:signal peptidase I [Paenibacillus sp. FSL K6-3166]|uniref:signal peptidase I n=1 Tax=Paenibacillus sp. FSL K6-3166 TaxID=2921492 RepID=UPI0030F575E1